MSSKFPNLISCTARNHFKLKMPIRRKQSKSYTKIHKLYIWPQMIPVVAFQLLILSNDNLVSAEYYSVDQW